jgi:ABC-type nitrate/sulfonate/bicarbonate transport system permease component
MNASVKRLLSVPHSTRAAPTQTSVGASEWPAWLEPRELARRWTAIALFLLLWELAPRVGLISPSYVAPFSAVALRLATGLLSGELVQHLLVSLGRSFAGFSLALGVGLPLGFALGWFRRFERFADPLIQFIRQVPVTSSPCTLPSC